MKKTLKVVLIISFMAFVLLALTGCGNKIVATREHEEGGITIKEKVEIDFKKDEITNVKYTFEFDSEEYAEQMKSYIGLMFSGLGTDVEQSGKKITIELDAEVFAEIGGLDEDELTGISKKELKEQLEAEGYKVK